jgi:4-diphosphocytidyl-2-C-methyl-D-erythritol kinase
MSKSIEKLTVFAPAKLNLHLAVLDKRTDGFHNLESLFIAINYCDSLHFLPLERQNDTEIIMEWDRRTQKKTIPIENNIIFKALSLFREKTGFNYGLQVRVEKHIPAGSGLGGGSSNAASTLLALNKMAGYPLNRFELLEIAIALGSDVPFFIHETPAAWVTGRGEHIEPLHPPPWFFVLVNPGFHSDTAVAFRLLEEQRKKVKKAPDTIFFNDFLPVFGEPEKSVYNKIISQLQELGANYASLSGAGSTCFGVFEDRAFADKAVEFMRSLWGFVELVAPTM